VPLRVYDETIRVLKSAVHAAKLGREEELGALKRLDEQARLLEQKASGPPVEELIADERNRSHAYEGRSVFGWALPREASRTRTLSTAGPPHEKPQTSAPSALKRDAALSN
jgi:hypothetical protein